MSFFYVFILISPNNFIKNITLLSFSRFWFIGGKGTVRGTKIRIGSTKLLNLIEEKLENIMRFSNIGYRLKVPYKIGFTKFISFNIIFKEVSDLCKNKKEMKKLKIIDNNIFLCIVSIIHFLFVFYIIDGFSFHHYLSFDTGHRITFITVKIISLILIFSFYKIFFKTLYAIQQKDNNFLFFIKHTFIYYILSLLVMVITWPFLSVDAFSYLNTESISQIKSYDFFEPIFTHFLTGFIYIVLYNIIPKITMIPVIAMFVFSLIFGYIITRTANNVSNKCYLILYIPFCIPITLLYNHMICKTIIISWFFLYFIAYLLFNSYKIKKFSIETIIMAVISSLCISYKREYLPILFIIPFMVLFLKVFTKKNFIIFSLIYLISFSTVEYIQNNFDMNFYKLHNFIMIYANYHNYLKEHNITDEEIVKSKEILSVVYKKINDEDVNWTDFEYMDTTDEINNKTAIDYLFKFIVKHSKFYLINNTKNFIDYTCRYDIINEGRNLPLKNIYKQKITNILVPNVDKHIILKILYTPYIAYIMLILLTIFGIRYKQAFYVWYSFILGIIICITTIFIPFYRFLYYYPYIFITNIVFSIMLIYIVNKDNKKDNI